MAWWPDASLPVVVEIAPGADLSADPSAWPWVDVSQQALVNSPVKIEDGRGDWGDEVDSGKCTVVFNNSSGDFSQYNPLGQWYGKLGQGTPLRVRLLRDQDEFQRTRATGWGTSASGLAWELWGAATDFKVDPGLGKQLVPAANAWRAAVLPVSLLDCEVRVTFDMALSDVQGGAIEPATILFRADKNLTTYYMARPVIDVDESVHVRLYHSSVGMLAEATVSGLTWSGQPCTAVAAVAGDKLSLKIWDPATMDEPGWQVTVTDQRITTPGRIGIRSGVASGNTNQSPVLFPYSDLRVYVDLWGGKVPAWVPSSDKSGKVRTVSVTGRGVLADLKPSNKAKVPASSPFRRTILSAASRTKLLAYWPCEDAAGSSSAASALPGGEPMAVGGTVTFAALTSTTSGWYVGTGDAIQIGSDAVPSLAGGGRLTGAVPVGTGDSWTVAFLAQINAGMGGIADIVIAEWATVGGSYPLWRLLLRGDGLGLILFGIDPTGSGYQVSATTASSFALSEYRIEAHMWATASTEVRLYLGGSLVDSDGWAITPGHITRITLNPAMAQVINTIGFSAGQIQIWDAAPAPVTLGSESLSTGTASTDSVGEPFWPYYRWLHESAHDRLARAAREDGISITVLPVDGAAATRMGMQPDGAPLELYQECENTDGGILFERPFGLSYTPRGALYAQPPALTLVATDLAGAPQPDPDNSNYRNKITAKRGNGSSAVAQTDQAAAAPVEESVEVNLFSDDPLAAHAAWRLHLATDQTLRWPTLALDLSRTPALLDGWLACRVGSRISLPDGPTDVAGQPIDVLLEGYALTLGYKALAISANCSPAGPWQVGIYGQSRYASLGTVLAGDVNATQPAITMQITAGPMWTTDAGNFPFDMVIGGERMTVTAIAAPVGTTQVATVTRSVNGIRKRHDAGERVDLVDQGVYAL